MQKISILGSTGSIGTQTLEVIANDHTNFEVIGLTAHSNYELLAAQIEMFTPKIVSINNQQGAEIIKQQFPNISVISDVETIAALDENDIVVNALVGFAGLKPSIEVLKKGKRLALANKESLVTGGEIINKLIQDTPGAHIIPIDSEHSAIFQCLQGNDQKNIEKIILTCSGGAFRDKTLDELQNVSVANALKHPNWDMGQRITIDSATLINKGFEVIETIRLFDVSPDQVEVVIHPQSTVHSFVQYNDGNIIAQVSPPDMRMAISYALYHPQRGQNNFERLNLINQTWNFSEPDIETFPCLTYAYDAIKTGGTLPTVLNAADEVAVDLFLNKKIDFLDIQDCIKSSMDIHQVKKNPSIDDIFEADLQTRKHVIQTFEHST
jgi:1-deoxy-D-xylulose-5-phosphate reductoisomerase